ncbi:TPA: 50S ribosomal protein L23 [Patescibacteria group bacterium]|uniref:Large ribosomal subunit protein uL23 n=2 Tax=Bacteria division Kazan-3B-28 TaxID=1798534 RepID=A0A0G1X6V1_UNCK3|nr:MAG: 50S ribosomal protein L23 [candidate division Kazan bacterium GW2011_GWA1_50_15]KKW25399.1 MAG: 50S ribosomal protein L23 [candidate division Kazan bacterium GW2011_GWC1_52_13]KKW26706.1 MAG: 50S ribosomal protein L23 [candidate division Kazan bacterium GW2011_GWB1_52_7]HAV65703.1 50S ribosomal protein L23 [Patescibacteria group bacterium]HCL47485.1 50S ribosomal protein L23 [Patescibacteria group bacterium]
MAKTLIHRPVISEKSISQGTVNKYTFVVDKSASKPLIADAIAKLFKVTVEDVRIINQRGKLKRFRRVLAKRSDRKKAVVTLKSGDRIALFEENK